MINVIDAIALLTSAISKIKPQKKFAPPSIKLKINKRKRLLPSNKIHNSVINSPEIKILTKEIKDYFVGVKLNTEKNALTSYYLG